MTNDFNNVIRELAPLRETARVVNSWFHSTISRTTFWRDPQDPLMVHTDHWSRLSVIMLPLLNYLPCSLILIFKAVYDYQASIYILLVFFTTFAVTNHIVKKEATKGARRNLITLFAQLLYISASSKFVRYVFENEWQQFDNPYHLWIITSVGQLLWNLTIIDVESKLMVITVKTLFTMLPESIVPFQTRAKFYAFMEALSQLQRSIMPIQLWLYYLFQSYQGFGKIVAVFWSVFYLIWKGWDLLLRINLLVMTLTKLVGDRKVGLPPTKKELEEAGKECPICRDNYDLPVLLLCGHIFCEKCVMTWFEREQTCPLCRTKIVISDDSSWRDGSTSYFIQLY